MKKISLLLIVMFFLLGISIKSYGGGLELDETREKVRQAAESIANIQKVIQETKNLLQETNNKLENIMKTCTVKQDNSFISQVQAGRYITAFNICRKQGGSIDECIQKIEDAKLNWKNDCPNHQESIILTHKFFLLDGERISHTRGGSLGVYCDPMYPKIAYLFPLPNPLGFSFPDPAKPTNRFYDPNIEIIRCREAFNRAFPNSQFNLTTYTGTITVSNASMHFQRGDLFMIETYDKSGTVIQAYQNRLNYKIGQFNISILIDQENKKYEIAEFNIPLKVESEDILPNKNKGAKLSYQEIIPMVNSFFHDTAWQVHAHGNFIGLLTTDSVRNFFASCLKEYLFYDNYIKTVKNNSQSEKQPKNIKKKQRGNYDFKSKEK